MTSIACTAEATVSPDEVVPCCSTAEKRMLGFSTLAIYAVALAIILYNFM